MAVSDDKNTNNEKMGKAWWQPGLVIFARSLSWIAGPVIAGAFLGKWLDKKYGTEPWLFLIIIGVAFIISMGGLIKEAMMQFKEIEKDTKKNKQTADDSKQTTVNSKQQ